MAAVVNVITRASSGKIIYYFIFAASVRTGLMRRRRLPTYTCRPYAVRGFPRVIANYKISFCLFVY